MQILIMQRNGQRKYYYYRNLDKLEEKNRNIEENWKSITWEECAKNVAKELKKY